MLVKRRGDFDGYHPIWKVFFALRMLMSEYALKASGYLKDRADAMADWDSFAGVIYPYFDRDRGS